KRDTRDDFEQSEIDNWRESGGDLQQAKVDLTEALGTATEPPQWMTDALAKLRDKQELPFSDQQIFDALQIGDYSSRYDDGKADPDITVDETAFPEGERDKLSEDMRQGIESAIIDAFNDKADRDRGDVDPPDWIGDNIESSQSDVWESMRDRDKFRYGRDNDLLTPEAREDVDPELYDLINSGDPKAIWAIADRPDGKDLLLGTDWNGSLDLNDPETMERFNAYVAKGKK
ncbi:MAG: hypothetical protein J2P55_02115, partial [Rhizobiales bacterium]|nr:hypothetical protein [Hyphomicrobiales bacterium]